MADSSNTPKLDADERARKSISTRKPGWCETHDEFAWGYEDGSVGCFWACIVETSTADCRWSERALIAAVERPGVERLVAALRALVETCETHRFDYTAAFEDAQDALAEFGQQPTGDES